MGGTESNEGLREKNGEVITNICITLSYHPHSAVDKISIKPHPKEAEGGQNQLRTVPLQILQYTHIHTRYTDVLFYHHNGETVISNHNYHLRQIFCLGRLQQWMGLFRQWQQARGFAMISAGE